MKKIIFTIAFAVSMLCTLSAQTDGKAIGVRFGNSVELSYQHPLSDTKRVELDLGLGGYRLGLAGIYQWVWDLSTVKEGLKWYAGPGAALGITTYSGWTNSMYLGIAGQVGIEYNFNFPLQLSLDYRPAIYLLKPSWMSFGSYDGICFSARYRL